MTLQANLLVSYQTVKKVNSKVQQIKFCHHLVSLPYIGLSAMHLRHASLFPCFEWKFKVDARIQLTHLDGLQPL